jgi:hypothetical protein
LNCVLQGVRDSTSFWENRAQKFVSIYRLIF